MINARLLKRLKRSILKPVMIVNSFVINKVENALGGSLSFLVVHPRISAHYSMRLQRWSIQIRSKVNAIFKMLSSVMVMTAVATEDFKLKQ